jgi:hypothetical protein
LTQQRDPVPDVPLLFGELQEELPIQEQIDQERSNEFDQEVLAQFVVQLKELKNELDEMMKDRICREKEYKDLDA